MAIIGGRKNSFGHCGTDDVVLIVGSGIDAAVSELSHRVVIVSMSRGVHIRVRVELMDGSLAYDFQKESVSSFINLLRACVSSSAFVTSIDCCGLFGDLGLMRPSPLTVLM